MKNTLFKKYSDVLKRESKTNVIRTFQKHEINIWTNKFTLFILASMVFFTIISFFDFIYFMGTIFGIIVFLAHRSIMEFILSREECIVSDRSIIIKSGVLFTDVIEFNYKSIEAISVKQSPIGTYFGFGDLTIQGSGGTKHTLSKIELPYNLANYIQDYKVLGPYQPDTTFVS